MDELRTALENVFDSYDDFVTGVLGIAAEYDEVEQITDYIKRHPRAGTSEIIGFIFTDRIEVVNDSVPGRKRVAAAML